MSSWANRNIPRKRDLSQIPEQYRPHIIPRVDRFEVRQSEEYQHHESEVSYANEVIYPSSYKRDSEHVNPKQYISKKIDILPHPSATELRHNDKTYVFVILRHLRNVKDNDLWITSYNSIRKFYTNKIVIIDDNSSVNTVDGKLYNADVIRSEFNGAGEILPYYYFFREQWADRMIFLHDSMFINRPFRDTELDSKFKFHWHFTKQETADYRKFSNYISLLKHSTDVLAFINDPDNDWKGCFGGGAIIDLETALLLEEEYNIFTTLSLAIKTRKDRETFERVLGIIAYYEGLFGDDVPCSNFGDITRYPGAFESDNLNIETAVHNLHQKNYDTAIIKVWRGR